MKKSLQFCYILALLICSVHDSFSQQVSIDNTIPLNQLIQDHLVDGCVEISNVTSIVNGSVDGFTSYGSFNSGSSSFPLSNGIILSSGNAASGGNTVNTVDLSEGTSAWGTDPDIETALGVGNTINATSIEFDFVAISGQIQFRYILASEEYSADFPCDVADGFAFLIRPTSSAGPYQNIALVPGDGSPVIIRNIHDEILTRCPAQNDTYFDGYNVGGTNYNGQTTILTALANVTPNTSYHVKLIVADQSDISPDPNIDTAVFIEASTFTDLELGDDITTCASSVLLDGTIQNPLASYTWYRDGIQIMGETNATLNVIQSGTYSVQITVTGISCVITDTAAVVIDTELSTDPIPPYNICDDGSSIVFDLSTKDSDVINAIQNLPLSYSLSYHYSDNDARNDVNAITTPITNNSNPQPIYVRVEDMSSGCLIFGTFNLVVNTPPSVSPDTLDLCDDDTHDNILNDINLTQKNTDFNLGNGNLVVSYYNSPADANSGNNPITGDFSNATSNRVYVRVTHLLTGCFDTTTLDITVRDSPVINNATQYIDACDKDYDGYSVFDLTSRLNDILMGNTNVLTPTFHLTPEDAESGSNPISNPSNYTNTTQELQTTYVRVVDASTGCHSIVPLEIHTNLLLTGTNIPPLGFAVCDTPPYGSEDYFLNTLTGVIANGLSNVTVLYYETIADRASGSNALNPSTPFTVFDSASATLHITINDGNCAEDAEILLRINPTLTFAPINPVPYCDTDDDGITIVDLSYFDDIVTGGNTDFSVRYFPDAANAENGTNSHPPFYSISGTEVIYAQISNIATNCATVNSFEVQVIPAPTVTDPNDIIICDTDGDGNTTVNLRNQINNAVSNPSGFEINFFTDNTLLDDNSNAIPDTQLDAYTTSTQSFYIKVEETGTSTSCYGVATFNVFVNTLPVIPAITSYQICEDDNDLTEEFRFFDKDTEILNGQTGKEVLYFSDQADASNRDLASLLDKNSYFNTSPSQTIYVRVENITDTSCFSTSLFTIEVASNPVYNTTFTDFTPVCENGIGEHTLNLLDKIQEISIGGSANLNVTFHLTDIAARDENATPLPNQYTTSDRQGQLYARIENTDNSCVVVEEVRFIIFPNPVITQLAIAPQCDTNNDGIGVEFNLGTTNYVIENARFSTFTATYYRDEQLISQITNTTAYQNISNPQTIYINLENNDTGCNNTLPFELNVNLPPTINNVGTLPICDTGSSTYNLSQIDPLVVNDPNTVNITYHNSANDALNNTGIINNKIYNYSNLGNYEIGIRVSDAASGCPTIGSFILQINPNPIANTPNTLIGCDDDFDGFLEFDLQNLQSNVIRGSQDPSTFTVSYYANLANAVSGSNPINDIYPTLDGETIYARIENNNTGCYATTLFNVVVNPLPIIPIEDVITLCINDLPKTISAETGHSGDTYLWINNLTGRTETTPEIQLSLTDLSDDWSITVTIPSTNCSDTKAFQVIESEEATIDFTTTVDFADPNSITVDVSGIGNYVFSLDGGEPQTSNVFNNVTLGPHIVTIIDLNGCIPIDAEVFVIDIPKFVTPNNDGDFDTWHIVGIERLPGTIVYIYDRFGKLLKTLPHTSIGWDGTFNGQNMPSNDYWFVANVNYKGDKLQFKGHFALKR